MSAPDRNLGPLAPLVEAIAERTAEIVLRRLREDRGHADGAEYVKVVAAARVAGVSRDTIRKWLDDGRLRRYGEGRLVLVSRRELIGVLAQGKGGAPEIEQAAGEAVRRLR